MPKPKDSMSALDFVIEVLREHEKELTTLSERLEAMIKDLTDGKFKESLNEVQKGLEALLKSFEGIEERLSALGSLDKSLSESLKALEEHIRALKDVTEAVPSKVEVEGLASRLSTIEEIVSGMRSLQAPIPERGPQPFVDWTDFKREASEAGLVTYQFRGRTFSVKAFSRGRVYTYEEPFPPSLEVKSGAQENLQVRLRCGLGLAKSVEKIDLLKGIVRVGFSIPQDVMLWLSTELKVHPNSVVEGDIP